MEPRIESRFLQSQVGFFIRRPCHIPSLGTAPSLDSQEHIPGLSSGLCVSVCYVSLGIRLILKKRKGGGGGNP